MSGKPVRIAAAAAVILFALWWFFSRGAVGDVTNLDSRGSAIIAFGDSLTAGYGAGAGEDYPSRLSDRIGTTVLNAGVSGDTTDGALARVEEDVLSRDPRIVIVGLGGNDFLRRIPLSATESNLREIVRKIHESGAMVALIGFEFPSFSDDYGEMYERVADEEKCFLVTGVMEGIFRDTNLKSDGIHPNARGYDLMAERIAPALRRLLEAARRG